MCGKCRGKISFWLHDKESKPLLAENVPESANQNALPQLYYFSIKVRTSLNLQWEKMNLIFLIKGEEGFFYI